VEKSKVQKYLFRAWRGKSRYFALGVEITTNEEKIECA